MPKLGWCDPRLKAQAHPTVMDIAWAAGIYEGEGCCWLRPRSKDYRTNHLPAICSVGQKEPWLTNRLLDLFGGSVACYTNKRGETQNYWRCSGARARGFLMTIYNFLSPHRKLHIRAVLAEVED